MNAAHIPMELKDLILYIKIVLAVALGAGAYQFVRTCIEQLNLWRSIKMPVRERILRIAESAWFDAMYVFAVTGFIGVCLCGIVFIFFYL